MAFQCNEFRHPIPAGGVSIPGANYQDGGNGVGNGKGKDGKPAPRSQDGRVAFLPGCNAAGLSNPPGETRRQQGNPAEINNNLSETLQGTIRNRDKTLPGLRQGKPGKPMLTGRLGTTIIFALTKALTGSGRRSRGRGVAVHQLGGCGGDEIRLKGRDMQENLFCCICWVI